MHEWLIDECGESRDERLYFVEDANLMQYCIKYSLYLTDPNTFFEGFEVEPKVGNN